MKIETNKGIFSDIVRISISEGKCQLIHRCREYSLTFKDLIILDVLPETNDTQNKKNKSM